MLVAMIAQRGRVQADDDGAAADELPAAGAEGDGVGHRVARVLRLGKTLSYGEVEFLAPDGKLAAHATTTYALI